MSETPDSVPSPAKDPRPRPQFGELAPEGWSWQPPEDTNRVTPVPTPTVGEGTGAVPPHAPATASRPASQPSLRTLPNWDRPWAIGLLTFGLLFTLYGAFSLGALPDALQLFYTQQGIGTYTPADFIGPLASIGAITLVFVWLATTAISVRLMLKRRRAFYVPLIGGAVSLVVLFGFMLAAMLSDPILIEFLSRQ